MESKDFNQIYKEYKEQSQGQAELEATQHIQEKSKSWLSGKMMMAI